MTPNEFVRGIADAVKDAEDYGNINGEDGWFTIARNVVRYLSLVDGDINHLVADAAWELPHPLAAHTPNNINVLPFPTNGRNQ